MTSPRSVPLRLAAFVVLALLSGAGRAQEVTPIHEVRVRLGDDARWARPGWDDADWPVRSVSAPPDTQAVFWVRTQVALDLGEVHGVLGDQILDDLGFLKNIFSKTYEFWILIWARALQT